MTITTFASSHSLPQHTNKYVLRPFSSMGTSLTFHRIFIEDAFSTTWTHPLFLLFLIMKDILSVCIELRFNWAKTVEDSLVVQSHSLAFCIAISILLLLCMLLHIAGAHINYCNNFVGKKATILLRYIAIHGNSRGKHLLWFYYLLIEAYIFQCNFYDFFVINYLNLKMLTYRCV